MAKKRYYESAATYATYKDMNEQNAADGSMMMQKNLGMANLPQDVIIKAYPDPYQYPDNRLMTNSDNMMGIDAEIRSNSSEARRYQSRSKY